jgi:hypothetical protein
VERAEKRHAGLAE